MDLVTRGGSECKRVLGKGIYSVGLDYLIPMMACGLYIECR
jgi:hypothetical protein